MAETVNAHMVKAPQGHLILGTIDHYQSVAWAKLFGNKRTGTHQRLQKQYERDGFSCVPVEIRELKED